MDPTDHAANETDALHAQQQLAALAHSADIPQGLEVTEAQAVLLAMANAAMASPNNRPTVPLPHSDDSAQSDAAVAKPDTAAWRAQRRYRALIEQIPVITFMAAIGETLHELYISPQIEAVLGYSQEEWLDNPFLWYNQLHPEDRERWQLEFARTCTTGVQFKSEYRILARDGHIVWIHGECQLIRDDNGVPLFLQGVAYDISESKRAEEKMLQMQRDLEVMVQQRTAELAAANAELSRSNAELSQFAYVASHDLQEPLRMMASFAQLLDERYTGRLDKDADEFIHYITDGAARMQSLIEDLLQYSRVGRKELARAPVDCQHVFATACDNLRTAIETNHAQVTAQHLPTVAGNEIQLLQLLQNLIANAIKFMPQGVPAKIEVGARREGGHWLFSVRDNGIGFDPQYAEKIFLIFQRLQSRVDYPGTGIGLAICRKIVERHGGKIWAESAPGQGSSFFFTIPLE